ncbi:MAG: hypothetical protein LQ350_001317 [Teloschistes chrysophthalmus]|nr:MAG: hypothetical protein LQ350_001317 [Niorma chrysophthalma]
MNPWQHQSPQRLTGLPCPNHLRTKHPHHRTGNLHRDTKAGFQVVKAEYLEIFNSFSRSKTGKKLLESMIIQITQLYKGKPKIHPGILEKRELWERFVTRKVKEELHAWATERARELVGLEPDDDNDDDDAKALKAGEKADVLFYIEARKKHAAIFYNEYREKVAKGLVAELKPKLL